MMPWLRLLRLPALFTTFPDVLAGYAIVRQGEIEPVELACLLISSACLYLAGMVFNDVFDVAQDTRERPQRPIPAGEISRKAASIVGGLLIAVGIAVTAVVSVPAVCTSVLLSLCILAYDAGGKKTALGPFLMGGCRSLNVMLGASCLEQWELYVAYPALLVAAVMGIYVLGITIFAKSEAAESKTPSLVTGLIICLLALLCWGTIAGIWSPAMQTNICWLMLILIASQLLRRAVPAIRFPSPQKVQQTVRFMLLTIPMLEAIVIVAHGGPDSLPLAAAAAVMMIPGQILSRSIPMT